MEAQCTHLGTVTVQRPESVEGCEECLKTGDRWVHLRICLECGHVGCCDDSPNKHATEHALATSHPVIQSVEPGEEWCWCYADKIAFERPPGI